MTELLQGDCVELLHNLPDNSVDLVLTDPPYGIDYQSAWRIDRSAWKPKILNDKKPFLAFIPELRRVLKPTGCAMIFTRWDVQQAFIDEMEHSGLRVRSVLIWDKLAHSMGDLKRAYGSRYESVLFHSGDAFAFPGKRPQDIVACPRVAPNKLVHPNEKPVELLETLISQVTKGGTLYSIAAWALEALASPLSVSAGDLSAWSCPINTFSWRGSVCWKRRTLT